MIIIEKTVVELFAGVGGFRVGLNEVKEFNKTTGIAIEKNNWNFVWANQWEPSTKIQCAFNCYITRFGNENTSNSDINLVDKNSIPEHSLLVGGFPCQDYSVARTKSNERGIQGKKGVLFWDIADTLEAKKTPFFLLENVDRLLKSPAFQRGRDFGIMLRTLNDLGYDLEWRIVNASDYGRAQRRRRVFVFGWRRDTKYARSLNNHSHEEITSIKGLFANSLPINDISLHSNININSYSDTVEMTSKFKYNFENSGVMKSGIVATMKTSPKKEPSLTIKDVLDRNSNVKEYALSDKQIEKFKYLKGNKRIERKKPNGETYFYSEGSMNLLDSLDLPGRTMLTSEGTTNRSSHIILDPKLNTVRFITPVEAERLQDFPDNWTDTNMTLRKRYFMMGNALVTGIISRLQLRIGEIIENE